MIAAEHRRPLAAFAVVVGAAGMIMGNGLRHDVVEILVQADGPRPVIAVIAPDLVLAQALRDAPPPDRDEAAASEVAAAEVPAAFLPVEPPTAVASSARGVRAEAGTPDRRASDRRDRPRGRDRAERRGPGRATATTARPAPATPTAGAPGGGLARPTTTQPTREAVVVAPTSSAGSKRPDHAQHRGQGHAAKAGTHRGPDRAAKKAKAATSKAGKASTSKPGRSGSHRGGKR